MGTRRIKNLLHRICYPGYFGAKVGYRSVVCLRNRKWLTKELGLKADHSLEISKLKRGNSLFIMGSGASVNEYTQEQWQEIRCESSLGVNQWVLHPFVPTLYMNEIEPRAFRGVMANYKRRAAELQNVPVIVKSNFCGRERYEQAISGADLIDDRIRANIHLARDFPLPGQTGDAVSRSLSWLDRLGFFTVRRQLGWLTQTRGTIEAAVFFGALAGFKRIVLCGVDLNNTKYFYQDMKGEIEGRGLRLPESTLQTGQIHKTATSSEGEIKITDALYAIRDFLGKKKGIELFVALPSSALHPEISAYPWKSYQSKEEKE